MRLQDQLVRMTQRALDDLVRAVEAMEPDKRDWSPAATSRSALHQLREVAVATPMLARVIQSGRGHELESHSQAMEGRLLDSAPTFEKAREMAMEGTAELCALIANFPDERLEEDVMLPFGGGIRMTMADCLALHYWNLTYHCGQVNYIQTMLGDLKMH